MFAEGTQAEETTKAGEEKEKKEPPQDKKVFRCHVFMLRVRKNQCLTEETPLNPLPPRCFRRSLQEKRGQKTPTTTTTTTTRKMKMTVRTTVTSPVTRRTRKMRKRRSLCR